MSPTDTSALDTGGRAGVLVVEDEMLVAVYLEDALDAIGYDCCGVVDNASQALEVAGRGRASVALVDIGLRGETDGIELARQLRERFGLPVILLTGATSAETASRAEAARPAGLLLKPCDEDVLAAALSDALGSSCPD